MERDRFSLTRWEDRARSAAGLCIEEESSDSALEWAGELQGTFFDMWMRDGADVVQLGRGWHAR